MGNKQKKTTRRLRLRTENRFESSDFAFGVLVASIRARPNRRPITTATVYHKRVVAEEHDNLYEFLDCLQFKFIETIMQKAR